MRTYGLKSVIWFFSRHICLDRQQSQILKFISTKTFCPLDVRNMFWVTILYKHHENSDKSFLMQSVRALQRDRKIYLIFLVKKIVDKNTNRYVYLFIYFSFNFYVGFTYSMRPLRYVFSIKLLCFYYVVLLLERSRAFEYTFCIIFENCIKCGDYSALWFCIRELNR